MDYGFSIPTRGTLATRESVLALADQVYPLALLLEIANSPFGSPIALAGTTTELQDIGAGIQTAKAIAQSRFKLLDATSSCGTP